MYLAFINPNLVRIYGYSSRNQKDKQAYIDLLDMRLKAKHNKLSDDFLKPLNLTNDDLKLGLKLPLNAYTGCLRATFNRLYDNLQGFSICATGQMLFLQLAYDLKQIPTLEICSFNTDAVSYMIEEEYKEQAHKVLHEWENLTELELEEDNIIKIVMRDVNNYASINKIGDNNYEVHYKGGELTRGEHKFKWNKEKQIFEYSYKPSLKSNSMSIVSEAILKFLLFDIPIRETIEKCDNIFRFQIISHLGSTYEKCVQESPNGDIELQRNNRIYAGLKSSGTIIKVKPDGRKDSLANCPPNPVVDNANELTIKDINKEWYIEFAQEKANDFLGIPRLESYKKEELLEKAKNLGLEIDKKIKKVDLIEMIKNKERNEVKNMATKQELEEENKELKERVTKATEQNEKLMNRIKENESINVVKTSDERANDTILLQSVLYRKINKLREFIRNTNFIYDEILPSNMGEKEYYSIGQYYDAMQNACLQVGLSITHNVVELISFDKELVKVSGKPSKHVATVKTETILTDIDTGVSKEYYTIAQGCDYADKSVSSANTTAFRQWFDKNFSPRGMTHDDDTVEDTPQSEAPKTPTYIPEAKKEEIKNKVVEQKQQEESDDEDIKAICENIMKIRELGTSSEGKDLSNFGASALQQLMSGTLSSPDILEIDLKVKQAMEKVGLNG